MWISCQSWPDSTADRTYSLNHKIYHECERNVDTIAQVDTISAYLSLSEGGFGKKGTNVGTIVEVGTISAYLSLSEIGFWAKIEQNGHYRMWIWTNIEQSGHNRCQNLAKIWQSGRNRNQH